MSRKPLAAASLVVLGTLLAGGVLADDLPKRKSGLWEMKTAMDGMPAMGAIQMCVDQNTDNIIQDKSTEKPNCSVTDVKTSGGKTTVHSVCKHEGTTVTTDGVITGDFGSGYKSDIKMRYSPAQSGMSEARIQQEAKWLGPCKPGQKPGDVMMPGMPGGKINMQEMMKQQKH